MADLQKYPHRSILTVLTSGSLASAGAAGCSALSLLSIDTSSVGAAGFPPFAESAGVADSATAGEPMRGVPAGFCFCIKASLRRFSASSLAAFSLASCSKTDFYAGHRGMSEH